MIPREDYVITRSIPGQESNQNMHLKFFKSVVTKDREAVEIRLKGTKVVVPVVAQWLTNPSIYEDACSIPGLA